MKVHRWLGGGAALAAVATISLSCAGLGLARPGRGKVALDPPGAGAERPLPLGSVRVAAADVDCARGALPGATCSELTVQCPDIPDLGADLAVTRAKGKSRGTVFTHIGSGGKAFFSRPNTVERWRDAGFDIVQVRWDEDWEITPRHGILDAACRPATVIQHAFDVVHGADRSKGFCAVGHSAGGAAVSYSLAHYGRGAVIDYAVIAAGPPLARIDYGCAPHTYDGPPRNLCPALKQAPMDLPPKLIDPWDNTWTCGDPKPHPDDLARWKADSIVSPGADYSYPRTVVQFHDCVATPNGTTAGAFFYSQQVKTEHSVTCYTECKGEDLGDAGWAEVTEQMLAQCVPRHG